jgi:hypothetical protein
MRFDENESENVDRGTRLERPNVAIKSDPLDLGLLPPTDGMAVPIRPKPRPAYTRRLHAVDGVRDLWKLSFKAVVGIVFLLLLPRFVPSHYILYGLASFCLWRAVWAFFAEHASWARCFFTAASGPTLWALMQLPPLTEGRFQLSIFCLFAAFVLLAMSADAVANYFAKASMWPISSEAIEELYQHWRDRWRQPPWIHASNARRFRREADRVWDEGREQEADILYIKARHLSELSLYTFGYYFYALMFPVSVWAATRLGAVFFQPMLVVFCFAVSLWLVALPWSSRRGLYSSMKALSSWCSEDPESKVPLQNFTFRLRLARNVMVLLVVLVYPNTAYFPIQPYVETEKWVSAYAALPASTEGSSTRRDSYTRMTEPRESWVSLFYHTGLATYGTLDYPEGIAAPVASIVTCIAFMPFAIVPLFTLLIGRVVQVFEPEAADRLVSSEHEGLLGSWDEIVDRLLDSTYEVKTAHGLVRERDHLFLGMAMAGRYPVLLDRRILREHAWFLGDSGTGKTARGIAPIVSQLIRSNAKVRPRTGDEPCSVVLIDMKGDPALFHGMKIEAEAAGVPFRWFTSTPGQSTYVFNPILQSYVQNVNHEQFAGNLLQAMGLEYGTDYGRAYFSYINRNVLSPVLKAHGYNIKSFRQLKRCIAEQRSRSGGKLIEGFDRKEAEKANHLLGVIDSLSTFEALNAAPGDKYPREVFENAIDMGRALETPQVLYFNLPTLIGASSGKEIGRLALFSLLSTAVDRRVRRQKTVQCFVFIDEFQQLVSDKISIFLEQARFANLGVLLANQHRGQLQTHGVDILNTVDTVAFKMTFGASGAEAREAMVKSSGEILFHTQNWGSSQNWSQLGSTVKWEVETEERMGARGNRIKNITTTDTTIISEAEGAGVSETSLENIGPRIRPNDVAKMSDHPDLAEVHITRGKGFSRFGGLPFFIATQFHISQQEFTRRDEGLDWPVHPHTLTPSAREVEEPLSEEPVIETAPVRAQEPEPESKPKARRQTPTKTPNATEAQNAGAELDEWFQQKKQVKSRRSPSKPKEKAERTPEDKEARPPVKKSPRKQPRKQDSPPDVE